MVGMAKLGNLLVLAFLASYNWFLVLIFWSLRGNISQVLSFLVHFTANVMLSLAFLAFSVESLDKFRAMR